MTCEPQPPVLHPAHFRITPSKPPSPWLAQWKVGARYSDKQLREMEKRGLDPETHEAIRVHRPASPSETYWPSDTAAPVHEYDCPILQRRADGRLMVLTPAGLAKLVLSDGWTRHPKKLTGWGRLSA